MGLDPNLPVFEVQTLTADRLPRSDANTTHYDVENLETVTRTNMIWRNSLWLCAVNRSRLLLKSPTELRSVLSCS